MKVEEWKFVPEYEGVYEVSTTGRIRTVEGKTTYSKRHGSRVWKQRELKQKTDRQGYKRVTLWKDGKSKDYLVHRLVALAFIEKVPGKNIINHIDCNPSNNNVSNLEWCNHAENLLHAYENRLNQSNDMIILLNTNTNEPKVFISMSSASQFLGRNNGYISSLLKRGITEVEEYLIFSRLKEKSGVD